MVDRWGGEIYLWHRMLAQRGTIVLSMDNRGTPAPRSMMAYPNRTHSISEGEGTRRHLFELMTRFLEQNLPPGPRSGH